MVANEAWYHGNRMPERAGHADRVARRVEHPIQKSAARLRRWRPQLVPEPRAAVDAVGRAYFMNARVMTDGAAHVRLGAFAVADRFR